MTAWKAVRQNEKQENCRTGNTSFKNFLKYEGKASQVGMQT